MGPKNRLSSESVRLSPITKYSPAGIFTGPGRLNWAWGSSPARGPVKLSGPGGSHGSLSFFPLM